MAVAAAPALGSGPQAGRDYPRSLPEFFERFADELACWDYLVALRWPDGFSCPACGHGDYWLTARYRLVCASCRKSVSVTAGTVLQDSRLPLRTWFAAAWLIATDKGGMSAVALQRQLGIGSYKTAWTLHHKLRKAMVRPGRDSDKLSGEIEVDETFVGGPRKGKRGRGALNKQIVVIAVECPTGHVGRGYGRTRMRVIPDCSRRVLEDFITDVCEPGSVIYTDGLVAYANLENIGYTHVATAISRGPDPAHVVLPAVHQVASLFKRWLLGTHQGGVAIQHLEVYLDEFVFRFNRRKSRSRGLLFHRLLSLAVSTGPLTYETIVWSRRGDADPEKLRGPERGSRRRRKPLRPRQRGQRATPAVDEPF